MNDIGVSIILPLYNEQKRFLSTIQKTREYMASLGRSYEIIVVNDGSTDDTKSIVEHYVHGESGIHLISYDVNRGKGHAIKTGMLAAKGNLRFFFDNDLAVPLQTIGTFLDEQETSHPDVIIGTRKTKDAVITRHQPLFRELLGKGYSRLTNIMLGTHSSDITCGFKLFTKEAAERIFSVSTIERWSFDAEILFLTKRFNLRVIEVPVTWHDDPATKVRLLKDIARSFYELVCIRMRYR